jgi:hypothetical protein
LTQLTKLLEAIQASNHDNGNGITNKISDEITGKTWNETRQAKTHTWAPSTSPKLKSLKDLNIRVNPKETEAVVHHVGM